MLHVPGMPEGVHVSFSLEDQPVSAPARPERYIPPALVGAGTQSEALTALLDAHELAYGHALFSEAYGLPDLAERRQAEEEAFRALLHTPMHTDTDRVAYAIAVISRQMHSLGDASATERDHPMAVAYRNLRFGEHAREPEEMRDIGRAAEPETIGTVDHEALALVDALEREWAALIVLNRQDHGDFSAEADARQDAALARWDAVTDAVEALPARSREARHAKALVLARCCATEVWRADWTRDQYGMEGRLALDLMDGLTSDASSQASSPAVAAPAPIVVDPHVALLPALRQAYAWTRDGQPIVTEATMTSPEYRAAQAVLHHCWGVADRILALPAPRTTSGLGAVALAMTVYTEGAIGPSQDDGLDDERYQEERRTAQAVRAMMSVANVEALPEWSGFGDEADSEARWDAMKDRAGTGSLPAWALAGKSGPDDEEIATGEEAIPTIAATLATSAYTPISDLARACNEQVERMAQWDRRDTSAPLTDEQLDADLDAWGAVLRRAIAEPAANRTDLVAKARLMLADLERSKPAEKRTQDDERLMVVILREIIAQGDQCCQLKSLGA